MTMISDLPVDLVEAVLSRVPISCLGAVRSTCKRWKCLSHERVLCKAEARHQFLGFMIMDYSLFSMRFDLNGILNEKFVDPSIKEIESPVDISQIFYCDGLLLCVTRYNTSLVVWNPYMEQIRFIQPRNTYHGLDRYALGYDNNKNRNHKILRYLPHNDISSKVEWEIYDLKSYSWRVLDVTPGRDILLHEHAAASLKGNTYFFAKVKRRVEGDEEDEHHGFLICFDFTTESFGQFLPLPFHQFYRNIKTLSSLREEKLSALFQELHTFEVEIWLTTKIEPNAVSWSKFLRIELKPFAVNGLQFDLEVASFFIDEEKKLAVFFDLEDLLDMDLCNLCNTAYVIGENGYLKIVNLGEAMCFTDSRCWCCPLVCSSSYVPSFVQINQTKEKKRKREFYLV